MDGISLPQPHKENNARASGPERGVAVKWEAFEYEHKERSRDWFYMLGIIAVAIAAASVILGNILFGLMVLLGAFVIAMYAVRPPTATEVELSPRGVRLGSRLYPYRSFKSFWVIAHSNRPPRLLLEPQKTFTPVLSIPLGKMDPEEVHTFLMHYLHEEERTEPFVDLLAERLGI